MIQKPSLEELVEKVREVITKDTELYENMLLYKVYSNIVSCVMIMMT